MDTRKISQIYSYLTEGLIDKEQLSSADLIFVFGRMSKEFVSIIKQIHNLSNKILITGGIGKDSGDLAYLGIPESHYLAVSLLNDNIPVKKLILETNAINGVENSKFGMDMILQQKIPHDNIIMVAHPISAKRLLAVHKIEAIKKGFNASYQFVNMYHNTPPDFENPTIQKEIIAEIVKLADWPSKGWAEVQCDLPMDLVEWARQN